MILLVTGRLVLPSCYDGKHRDFYSVTIDFEFSGVLGSNNFTIPYGDTLVIKNGPVHLERSFPAVNLNLELYTRACCPGSNSFLF
ncbi:hypothetical protein A2U01_0024309, partial [Trifolium medium]|nr:hypothetical protein [Trifolium medium]